MMAPRLLGPAPAGELNAGDPARCHTILTLNLHPAHRGAQALLAPFKPLPRRRSHAGTCRGVLPLPAVLSRCPVAYRATGQRPSLFNCAPAGGGRLNVFRSAVIARVRADDGDEALGGPAPAPRRKPRKPRAPRVIDDG